MLLPRQSETDQAYRQRSNFGRRRRIRCRRARCDGNRKDDTRIREKDCGKFGVQGVEPQGNEGIAQDERENDSVDQRKGRPPTQHGAERQRDRDQRHGLDGADDAKVDRLALGHDRGYGRHEEELAAPVASLGQALTAHVARDRRLGVGLQPCCWRQVGP